MLISCDRQNNPLYIQSFTEADDALKLHHIVHCSLDVVDERGDSVCQILFMFAYYTSNFVLDTD